MIGIPLNGLDFDFTVEVDPFVINFYITLFILKTSVIKL